jgi:hypothetical protein
VAEPGIDQIQGYFVAKPMSADDFQSWYLERDGVFDIGERDLSGVDIYGSLIKQGAA